jgi:YD repeat-containing protein
MVSLNLPVVSKRIWISLVVFWAAVAFSHAQTKTNDYAQSDYFSNFNPSIPNKSALGSFGSLPINYFTGLPEINLNLLTLSSRDVSVPVSLTYDATGVKLDDIAGPVGLKWNLSSGGYVVRQMNGYPDEHPTGGYWKHQTELNAPTIDHVKWVKNSERGVADTEPDEFYAYLPGRTVKFFFKDGQPQPIPRQNVYIQFTLKNDKIDGFTITTGDGTIYTFGADASAIEERKVENSSIVANFAFDYKDDTYAYTHNGDPRIGSHAWFYWGDILKIYDASYHEKVLDFYNSKWYLRSIKSASLDVVTFNYTKSSPSKYVTQPVVTRKIPLLTSVNNYTYDDRICFNEQEDLGFVWCADHRDRTIVHTEWKTPSYALFSNSCPDYNYSCSNTYPSVVEQHQSNLYLDPKAYKIDPEGIFVNQSLITESVIKLDNITSATGNKVKFYYSGREDFPGTFKCDRIELVNMKNVIVKHFKFNYSIVDASKTTNDNKNYMWPSEAIMVSTMYDYRYYIGDIYAHALLNNSPGDVGIPLARKYAYEGLRAHNYKRLYLDAIIEVSASNTEQTMYRFAYQDRSLLRRRLTPMQTVTGFTRNEVTDEEIVFGEGVIKAQAKMTNAYDPASFRDDLNSKCTYGMLVQMTYPTGGYTKFSFAGRYSPSLYQIVDYDLNGAVVAQRSLSYHGDAVGSATPILESYQNSRDAQTNRYVRYKILSSVPQNRSFRPVNGVFGVKTVTTVYNGKSATDHNGYEIHKYSLTPDLVVPIFSSPKDLDASGNPMDNLSTSEVFPFPKRNERDYLGGMPIEQSLYDKNGRLVKSTINEYAINPNGYTPLTLKGFIGGSFPFGSDSKYRYARHTITSDWVVLHKTTEKIFDQSAAYSATKFISKETSYHYGDFYPKLKTVTAPAGVFITSYKYVIDPDYDFSGTPSSEIKAIHFLRSSHQHGTVVEELTSVKMATGFLPTSGVLRTFKVLGSTPYVKPDKVYAFSSPPFDPRMFKTSLANADGSLRIDSRFRLTHSYDQFDSQGNLLAQTTFDGTSVKYVWDSNFNNAFVKTQIVNEGVSEQRTSYSQIPLVGLTSVIDPNGVSKTFEYDEFRRLKLTRDNGNNILNRYRYHLASGNATESMTASILTDVTGWTTSFSTPEEKRSGKTTYAWDFGDGTTGTSTSRFIDHVYSPPGTFVVKVTKSNPEYGSSSAQQTVTILPPLQVTICADGPVRGDVCRQILSADAYGSCTAPANRYWAYQTRLKSTATSGCNTGYSYFWEYKISGQNTWIHCGSTSEIGSPFTTPAIVTGDVRCSVTDACGNLVTSAPINFSFFKTCP